MIPRKGDTITITNDYATATRTVHSVVHEANGSTTIYDTQADAWYPDHPDYDIHLSTEDNQ